MLIKIKDLPDSLRNVVADFCDENYDLADPEGANGECTAATLLFYEVLIDDHGWDPQWLDLGHEKSSWWWAGSTHPWDECLGSLEEDIGPKAPHDYYYNNGWNGHVCVCVSEKTLDRGGQTYFIDFTARQYSPKAPFPLIWKEEWSWDE
jgi:hypothetical protein